MRSIEILGRVLLCISIAVASFLCLSFVQDISRDRNIDASKTVNLPDSSSALASALNGNWQFAETAWSFQLQDTNATKLKQLLSAGLPASFVAREHFVSRGSEDDTEQLIFSFIESIGAVQSVDAEVVTYRIDSETIKGVAYAPTSAPRRIQIARVANRVGDTDWKLLEVIRRTSMARLGDKTALSLLPESRENTCLAMRYDATGKLCAQLIEMKTDFDALRSFWNEAGWQEHTSFRLDGVLPRTNDLNAGRSTVFTKNSEAVVAFLVPGGENFRNTLLLTRAP